MKFVISEDEKRKRTKNLLWGLVLSLVLAGFIGFENARYPEQYNDVLFWSVVGFIILANLVNGYRHRRYVRKIQGHYVEVLPGKIRFVTDGDTSELDMEDIVALRFFRNRRGLQHIQLVLKSHRGVRLEGYQDLDELAKLIVDQLPPEKLM